MRATMSVEPPGGNGTTRRMGLDGYCCAAAPAAASIKPRKPATAAIFVICSVSSCDDFRISAMQAHISYTADTGEKLVNETFGPNNIRRRTSGSAELHEMEIGDGRRLASGLSLEVNGFELVEHRTAVKNFFDAEELKRSYY